MKIIAQYSDFEVDTINFFIAKIRESIDARGLTGLTNGQVDLIPVLKEHPLIQYMESKINPNVRNGDDLRAGMVPGIGVTPGNCDPEMETMGESTEFIVIDDAYISMLKGLLSLSDKEIQQQGVLTKDQINTIIGAYKRLGKGVMRGQLNKWAWNEEVNISCWAESPDYDTIMSRIIDSVLAGLRVGFLGDNSPIRKMKYKPVRGLTNFNFGRVLYGSEFNLTFLNIYTNYTIYTEESITDMTFKPSFIIPGGGK